ncbi:MAG: hypothetical protein RLY43_1986 [Bacteroidota bacterium]|jgi:hypothetical protein
MYKQKHFFTVGKTYTMKTINERIVDYKYYGEFKHIDGGISHIFVEEYFNYDLKKMFAISTAVYDYHFDVSFILLGEK